ncbi:DUF29 domain-containing protein [Cronbergia sp. UHCC 0137]|uniref:DUF29 domain-containing protein n=1 Tax=Cronbergia sp. UHCC 0137 TaxID=3110239 RepID=UPI002B221954|nr:DUF29 domain-containing protein [Cronbergia sp. UHCC 0137]MEA5618718.1 DUF29 domain-containing protein [Cronbergia sp. UHCC 0137]
MVNVVNYNPTGEVKKMEILNLETDPQAENYVNISDRPDLSLYDQDFMLWIENTIRLLKEQSLTKLDLENLINEIEDMGRNQKHALESNLTILLMHLLKWQYQSVKRSNNWKFTIREHRQRLQKSFRDSPSLKVYCEQVFHDCYQDARNLASDETGIEITLFPMESPYGITETLNQDFLPN